MSSGKEQVASYYDRRRKSSSALQRNSSSKQMNSGNKNRNITFANNTPNVNSRRYLFAESRKSSNQKNLNKSHSSSISSYEDKHSNLQNRLEKFK